MRRWNRGLKVWKVDSVTLKDTIRLKCFLGLVRFRILLVLLLFPRLMRNPSPSRRLTGRLWDEAGLCGRLLWSRLAPLLLLPITKELSITITLYSRDGCSWYCRDTLDRRTPLWRHPGGLQRLPSCSDPSCSSFSLAQMWLLQLKEENTH